MEKLGIIFANAMAQLSNTINTAVDEKRKVILSRIETVNSIKTELTKDQEELEEFSTALDNASDKLDDIVCDIDFLIEEMDKILLPQEEEFDINDLIVEDIEEED